LKPALIIVGKVVPYLLLAFVNALMILGLGKFMFGMPINGSGFDVENLYAFRHHGFIVGDFNFDHNGQSVSRFDVLFNGVDVANNYPFGLYFSN
jgi:hypothetical protein